jgi:hypothetical protein
MLVPPCTERLPSPSEYICQPLIGKIRGFRLSVSKLIHSSVSATFYKSDGNDGCQTERADRSRPARTAEPRHIPVLAVRRATVPVGTPGALSVFSRLPNPDANDQSIVIVRKR